MPSRVKQRPSDPGASRGFPSFKTALALAWPKTGVCRRLRFRLRNGAKPTRRRPQYAYSNNGADAPEIIRRLVRERSSFPQGGARRWMSRTQKVQAENVSAVAHPLRRTACAHVGTTGWPCRMTSARSFCGRIAETSLQTIIALCCTRSRFGGTPAYGGCPTKHALPECLTIPTRSRSQVGRNAQLF
jgi:hypothetical protein